MRRREHERIVRDKDRTIARLEAQNRDLLDRLMYALDRPWQVPPDFGQPRAEEGPLIFEDFGPEMAEELPDG